MFKSICSFFLSVHAILLSGMRYLIIIVFFIIYFLLQVFKSICSFFLSVYTILLYSLRYSIENILMNITVLSCFLQVCKSICSFFVCSRNIIIRCALLICLILVLSFRASLQAVLLPLFIPLAIKAWSWGLWALGFELRALSFELIAHCPLLTSHSILSTTLFPRLSTLRMRSYTPLKCFWGCMRQPGAMLSPSSMLPSVLL